MNRGTPISCFKQISCIVLFGVYLLSSNVFVHAYGMDMVVQNDDGGCTMHHEGMPHEVQSADTAPLDISCIEQCIGTYDDYSYQQVKREHDNLIANKTDRQSHIYLWQYDHTPKYIPLLSSNGDPGGSWWSHYATQFIKTTKQVE